jgi:hypothetical protein
MADQQPNDDPSVPDDSYVLRRIPPGYHVFDAAIDRHRPNSGNFKDDDCSVVLSVALREQNRDDLEALTEYPDFLLVKILVGAIRECGLGVVRAPIDSEPAHGHITGKKSGKKKNKLAKASIWIMPPKN